MIKQIFTTAIGLLACLTILAQPIRQTRVNDANRNVPVAGVLSSGQLPDMNAFTADGSPIKVRELCKGQYTMLASGCLTCPLFHQNYPEIEATFTDYAKKGVQFYYFYKSIRHPELDGYVEAQNISERLLQVAEIKEKLETKVPWIVDTMEDDMRVGLRSGSWSVYLISPEGEIVYASGRIDAQGLRKALTKAVGSVNNETKTSDLNLPTIGRNPRLVNEDSELGVFRPEGLSILTIVPSNPEDTYYVKLRAEADDSLLSSGTGRLFLGFYPDPIHDAHWNNLTPPMKYKLTLPKNVVATPSEATAKKGPGDSDTKPRQFWVDISSDKPFDKIELKLDYFGCTPSLCLALTHRYTIIMEEENRGSRTYGMNRGRVSNTNRNNSNARQLDRLDANKNGVVSFDEMYNQMKKRNGANFSKKRAKLQFDRMDINKDGVLSAEELSKREQNKTRRRVINE